MTYTVEIMFKAIKDLTVFPKKDTQKIIAAIHRLEGDLISDVRRLTNHTPEYRARHSQADRIYTFNLGDFSRLAPDLADRVASP